MEMELPPVSRFVLDLIVSDAVLATPDAWKHELHPLIFAPADEANKPQQTSASRAAKQDIFRAIDQIVPHLCDCKTFHQNVHGLLKFCEQEYPQELFELFRKWLTLPSSSSSLLFRKWLYGYVQDVDDVMVSIDSHRWKQALLLAALQEQEHEHNAMLKKVLLKHIDQRVGSLEGVISQPQRHDTDAIRLLVFCWHQSDVLSQSAALCAAKLSSTLSTMTPTSSGGSDEMFTILRWAKQLKPLLFENLVDCLVTLQVVSLKREQEELHLPLSVQEFVQQTTSLRSVALRQLTAFQQQIQSAYSRRVKYLRRSDSPCVWITAPCAPPSMEVIAFLAQDLGIIHSDVFPHVFAVFAVAISHVLSAQLCDQELQVYCIKSLFSILELRSDPSSLFLTAGAIINLQLALHAVWRGCAAASIFQRIVKNVSEAYLLETTSTKKWANEIVLHHLLLECDEDLLLHVLQATGDSEFFVPEKTLTFVKHRFA